MKSAKYVIIQIVLILSIAVLVVLVCRSVMRPQKLKEVCVAREKEVIKKLEDIRILQAFYKSEKGCYAESFDQLKDFWNNGKMTIVVKEGSVPDTLTEEQALKRGIIRRDTVLVDAQSEMVKKEEVKAKKGEKDKETTKLPKDFNINTFDIVPYSKGERFTLQADSIRRGGNVLVFVYQVMAEKKQYLKDLDNDPRITSVFFGSLFYSDMQEEFLGKNYNYREDIKDLILGSLTEPSTDGNWQ